MDEQIRQIAERLRGLRDVLELTADDIARDCDISALLFGFLSNLEGNKALQSSALPKHSPRRKFGFFILQSTPAPQSRKLSKH